MEEGSPSSAIYGGDGSVGECFAGPGMDDQALQEEMPSAVGCSNEGGPKEGSSRRKKGYREVSEGSGEAPADGGGRIGGKVTEHNAVATCGGLRGGTAGSTPLWKSWDYGSASYGAVVPEGASVEEAGEAADMPTDYTTVMLRNIPNKYSREMLVKQLSLEFCGEFNFMYLPIDFKNKCNVGYCFINFRTPEACSRFVAQFHGVDVRKCLPGLNSRKVAEVTPARVQGMMENVNRLRNSPVMNQLQEHPEWMPLIFDENGELEPFPSPEQPLPPVKQRGRGRARLLREASA
jgi:hypothetical protein